MVAVDSDWFVVRTGFVVVWIDLGILWWLVVWFVGCFVGWVLWGTVLTVACFVPCWYFGGVLSLGCVLALCLRLVLLVDSCCFVLIVLVVRFLYYLRCLGALLSVLCLCLVADCCWVVVCFVVV